MKALFGGPDFYLIFYSQFSTVEQSQGVTDTHTLFCPMTVTNKSSSYGVMGRVIKTHKPPQYLHPAMCAVTENVFLQVREVVKRINT